MEFYQAISSPGAKVLDAACGTGRYAEARLAAGYHVGASDFADANVQPLGARELLWEAGKLCVSVYAGAIGRRPRPCQHRGQFMHSS